MSHYLKKELYDLIKKDESIFDFIQDSSLDGLWYWDLENPENEWMNGKFWTVLGYNPEEMPHKSNAWQNIINQDDLKIALENFKKHSENPNHPYDQVVRYRHKNGSIVWIHCRGLAIRDTNGKPIRMLGTHQDVSHLKNREQELLKANEKVHESERNLQLKNEEYETINEELRQTNEELLAAKEKAEESGEKYRAMYNNAPLSYQSLDESGCFIDINPMWSKTLGYERSEVIGKWYGDFLHPDYVEHFRKNFPAFKKRGYVSNVQFRLRRKDNTYIYVSFEGCIGYTPEGEFKQTYCVFKDITENKQAEEALHKSEVLKNTIVSNIGDVIVIIDKDGINQYKSPNVTKLFGWKPEELIGESIWDLVYPDDVEAGQKLFGTIVTEPNATRTTEVRYKRKDGEYVWIEITVTNLFHNKDIQGVLGNYHDISERKRAEQELLESEEMLRNSQSLAHICAYSTDLNINELEKSTWKGSPQFYKIFGIDETYPHTLEGWAGFIHPDYREKIFAYHQYVVDERIPFNNEYKIIRINDGAERWVQGTGELEFDEMETPVRMHGAIQDITERKRAEEKLRNLSEMQSIILRMASEYINMPQELVDKSINNSLKELGEFVLADRAYVFEYDWIKNVCSNIYEWCEEGVTPEIDNLQNVPNEVMDYWVKTHKNGDEVSIEDIMQLPPDNEVRQLLEPQGVKSVLAIPMMKRDKCIGFIGFDSVGKIHKYSDREKTLLRIFSEMLVNIGNRKELEMNLVKAKEKAEESDRLKSAFLANMSHEIRTPMNGILGFANLLKRPDLKSKNQQKYIEIIEESGKRMLNIINDIVDISKIEAGQMKLDVRETNVNEQIEYVYTFFKPEAESKGIKLSLINPLTSKEATINTDSEKVYAILTNLLKNAIKYTEKGSIELGYHLKTDSEPGGLEFYVQDTGIGIPKERQEAIFERFIQADIADTRAFEGSGLGLAITKSYVEMLGGNIWVESQEGEGSTFYFTLPYSTEAVIETKKGQHTPSEKNMPVRKLKILVAEDDEVSEMLLDETVKMFGKEILKARTGAETVEVCRANPDIDLILMDIQMPDMGGYEATQRIREFNKRVIIIAQTAYGLTGDRRKSIESGCNDYIAKPIHENELQAMIQKYFGK